MAIEGPIRELGLSDVFQLLDLSRKTGTLTVRPDPNSRPARVQFDRGAIVGVQLPGLRGRIGNLLLRAGKITEGRLKEALSEQRRRPGRRLGTILVQMGFVSEQDVQRQLRFHIQESVCHLVDWKDGYFHFEEEPIEVEELSVRLGTESLLMEAARRIDEWSTLEGKIPHLDVVPALTGDDEGSAGAVLDLRPDEWELLAEIDGRRTLREIAATLGKTDFDVAKMAFGLVSTGVVQLVEEMALAPVADGTAPGAIRLDKARALVEDGDHGRALTALEEASRRHPEDPGVHLLLARALLGVGREDRALDALDRVTRLDPLSAEAHYHLGVAAARTGNLARAQEAWTTALRLPDLTGSRRGRARRGAEAARVLRSLLEEEAP